MLERVEAKTKELNTEILPKDVKVVPFYDRSDLVQLTTETVERIRPRRAYICRNRCRKLRLTGRTSSRPLRWIAAVSLSPRVTWLIERRFTTTDR